jgi:tripartite-type tricarboxylate transporter receptor subunit TctC
MRNLASSSTPAALSTRRRITRRSLLVGGAVALAPPLRLRGARAQAAWPHGQPVKIVVPFPPGGAVDTMGRLLGQVLQERMGATVVVEDRAGGNGVIGTMAVLQAPPDGYTLLASAFNHTIMNHAVRGATFDPQADFEPVARTARTPLMMVMSQQRPQKDLAALMAAVRAAPNDWTFAVATLSAAGHLATIEFLRRLGVAVTMTSYRGTAPALTDVIGGHVQLLIDASPALLPTARDGKVRALGIAAPQRSSLAPEFPTLAEAGMPDFTFESWYGVWAPKGTPRDICERINAMMREAVKDAAVGRRLRDTGLEPVSETIAEMRGFIAADVPRQIALLESVNFQPQ